MGLGGCVPKLATCVLGLRIVGMVFGLRRIERGRGVVAEPWDDDDDEEIRSLEEADDAVFTRELAGEVTPLIVPWCWSISDEINGEPGVGEKVCEVLSKSSSSVGVFLAISG